MSKKGIMEKFSAEEVVESFVITQKVGGKQKKAADHQLREAREKAQAEMSEKDRLSLKLMQFKFEIEDYLNSERFNPKLTFGYFLKEYVNLQEKKRKNFAKEIDINETELSQLINKHRIPNENIIVRLEIHSNNSIPAVTWYKLVEREKEYALRTNRALRQQEKKFVTNKLPVYIR